MLKKLRELFLLFRLIVTSFVTGFKLGKIFIFILTTSILKSILCMKLLILIFNNLMLFLILVLSCIELDLGKRRSVGNFLLAFFTEIKIDRKLQNEEKN